MALTIFTVDGTVAKVYLWIVRSLVTVETAGHLYLVGLPN